MKIKKLVILAARNVMLKEENDKHYLEKELSFNKDKLLENLIKENDNKNLTFIKYKGKIYSFKLEITKAFFKKMKDKDNQKFQRFLKFQSFISDHAKNLSISYSKKHHLCKLETSDCHFTRYFCNIRQCQFVSFTRIVCQKQIFYERF